MVAQSAEDIVMSGKERADPGEGGAMLARVFDCLRGMREEQRRNSKQLEKVTSLLLGLTDQVRRMDRRLGEVDRWIGDMDRHLGKQTDDLDLMLKAELLGQFGMLRAEMGHRQNPVRSHVRPQAHRNLRRSTTRPLTRNS